MSSANYNITTQQHSTFDLHMEYLTDENVPIDLSPFTARFHVKPSEQSDVKYIQATLNGVTCGATGGSGGIFLNTNDGGGGLTGGLRIIVDGDSMGSVPEGSWHYSLELAVGVTTEEIMNGRFVVLPKVARG